jgi:hypothetical protein
MIKNFTGLTLVRQKHICQQVTRRGEDAGSGAARCFQGSAIFSRSPQKHTSSAQIEAFNEVIESNSATRNHELMGLIRSTASEFRSGRSTHSRACATAAGGMSWMQSGRSKMHCHWQPKQGSSLVTQRNRLGFPHGANARARPADLSETDGAMAVPDGVTNVG